MHQAFTLIELLLVVVIIGIVAAFVLPRFDGVKEKAYEAAMKNDLRNLATEQEIYFSDHAVYADSVADLGVNLTEDVAVDLVDPGVVTDFSRGWVGIASHAKTNTECTIEVNDAAEDGGGDNDPTFDDESAVDCH